MPRRVRVMIGRIGSLAITVGLPTILLALGAAAADGGASRTSPEVALRLPADIVYERTVGADSAVVFSHESHFAAAGNRCTACHPQPFHMLKPVHHVSHREMNVGGSCGSCHDGKQAFGVRDPESCGLCHSGRPSSQVAGRDSVTARGPAAPRRGPKPIAYPRGDASPGRVTFRHETHLGGQRACADCHPRPFAMKSAGPRPGGAMHESEACGACHDGTRAFGTQDAASCARCHAETGATP
jgi:c(7)-type cytochrome triheme protein